MWQGHSNELVRLKVLEDVPFDLESHDILDWRRAVFGHHHESAVLLTKEQEKSKPPEKKKPIKTIRQSKIKDGRKWLCSIMDYLCK